MKFLALIALIFTWGCASSSVQKTPSFFDKETGKETDYRVFTIEDTNFLGVSTIHKFAVKCISPKDESEKPTCGPADTGQQVSAPGVLPGFGSVVVESAGIAAAGWGVGKAGDTDTSTSTHIDNQIMQEGQNAVAGDSNSFTNF